jgi:hypothetical protein
MSVLFPAPEVPITPKISPFSTVRETLDKAWTTLFLVVKRLETFISSIIFIH